MAAEDYKCCKAKFDTVCHEKDCGTIIHKGDLFVYDTVEQRSYCTECGELRLESED
jgi:hypothetical protein